MDLLLLKVPFIMHIIAAIWLICALTLVLIILIQKGRGGGLSGAFGGGGAGGIMGTKTGDFLTWVTVTLAGVFLILSVVMAKFYRPGRATVADEPAAQSQPVQQNDADVPPMDVEDMDMQGEIPQEDMPAPDMAIPTDTNQG